MTDIESKITIIGQCYNLLNNKTVLVDIMDLNTGRIGQKNKHSVIHPLEQNDRFYRWWERSGDLIHKSESNFFFFSGRSCITSVTYHFEV